MEKSEKVVLRCLESQTSLGERDEINEADYSQLSLQFSNSKLQISYLRTCL